MKRFFETTKWDDPWYAGLDHKSKLVWEYLISKADNAGIWQPNLKLAEFQIGTVIDWDKSIKALEKNLMVLPNGKWWITSLISFQYGELSGSSPMHKSIIAALNRHGLLEAYNKLRSSQSQKSKGMDTLTIPLGYPSPTVLVEVKDKEEVIKDRESEGKDWSAVLPFDSEAFKVAWVDWVKYRSETRKRLTPSTIQTQLAEMKELGEEESIARIKQSISNGWQGLFEIKKGGIYGNNGKNNVTHSATTEEQHAKGF